MTNTKIVATLGPATREESVVRDLIRAGVDVFRLNASHGTAEDRKERIRLVRRLASEEGSHTGILLDLQGPKIRLGTFEGGQATLETGTSFTLTTANVVGTRSIASTTYTEFAKDVKPGDRVLLNDGAAELQVLASDGLKADCKVISGGTVGDRKGINLPGVSVSTPSLTRKDMADVQSALEEGFDLVALSFVRKASDVLRLRLYLEEKGVTVPIIAKIEKPEAVDNLTEILQESDGVMVARGDLGVEVAPEKVPFIQKAVIQQARQRGKFVITATQMLETMVEHNHPTRAEVSDVANAIYDGTDAVMLSAETSTGKYPVEAVRMMDRIAREAEASLHQRGFQELPSREYQTHAEIVADSAYRAARLASAAGIVVFSASGGSARLVAKFRPPVPIFVFTPSEVVARQLSIVYGAKSIIAPDTHSTDEMMSLMERILLDVAGLKARDSVVFFAGQPIGRPGSTNLLKIHRIGDAR